MPRGPLSAIVKILIASRSFPDEDACTLREYGHDVNCAREVKAAQRCVNDGYIPDLLYVENKLDSAQFFAKQVRSKHEGVEIYVMVSNGEASTEDPSRLGIDGFIFGDLKVEQIIERAGDLRPPEPEAAGEIGPEEELSGHTETRTTEYIPKQKPAQSEGPARPTNVITITLPRPFKRRAEKAGLEGKGRDSAEEGAEESGSKYRHAYRLAFPAILAAFALAAMLNVYGPKMASGRPVAVLEDLVGKTFEESRTYLDGSDVPYEVVEVKSEEGGDLVVDQDPRAGTALSDIDTVTIMVSRKAEEKDPGAGPLDADGNPARKGGSGTASPPSPAPNSRAQSPAAARPAPPAPDPAKPAGSGPAVSVSASRTSGPSSGFMVSFSASAYDPDGGSIVSYSWSCGGSGPSTSHEFTSNIAPSTVTVTVTVTDDEGQTAAASVVINLI